MKIDKLGMFFVCAVMFAAVLAALIWFFQDYQFVFALIGGSLLLACLWMVIQKLGSIEKKLDELLKEKK